MGYVIAALVGFVLCVGIGWGVMVTLLPSTNIDRAIAILLLCAVIGAIAGVIVMKALNSG